MKKIRLKARRRRPKKKLHEINAGGKHSAGGHEDIAYGIFDRPEPQDQDDEERFSLEDITGPVVPSEMVSTQLATERPPIDDTEYVPNTVKELAAAVGEMTKEIPVEQIQSFYEKMQRMIEKAVAEGEDENMSEANLRKRVAAILREAVNKAPDWTKDLGDEDGIPWWVKKEFSDEFEPDAPEEEEVEEEQVPIPEEYSLEDIAKETGFSGPSGAKNFIVKLATRVKRFSNIPDDEFDALIEFAAAEYIDLLEQTGSIDAQDVAFMNQNKDHVASLPSFKYFLFYAMILPAAKEIEKTSRKLVEKQLSMMGLSPATQHSLMNQLIGVVPHNQSIILSRLLNDVKAGKLKPERAKEIAREISKKFAALQSLAQGGDDFAEVALQKYAKQSKGKALAILKKASTDPYVEEASDM